MLLWPENYAPMQCQPVSVDLNKHIVCDSCKEHLVPKQLVPKEDFEQIQKMVMHHGKNKPSAKTAKLTFFIPETMQTKLAGELAV
jgi:hypothetical protein